LVRDKEVGTPSPKEGYRTKDGKRVPSVTTVLSRFKSSGGLIHWSWQLAAEPLAQIRSILRNGADPAAIAAWLAVPDDASDYRQVRDQAGSAGTCAHAMFDAFVRQAKFDDSPFDGVTIDMARPAFEAAREWASGVKFKVTDTETSLVSEQHRFGGTKDGCLVAGRRAVMDVKTGSGIYAEVIAQLGAYQILDEEAGNIVDGGGHILHFMKADVGQPIRFAHYYWGDLNKGKDVFLKMRFLYSDVAELEKLVK
jgi:hypothetical protein